MFDQIITYFDPQRRTDLKLSEAIETLNGALGALKDAKSWINEHDYEQRLANVARQSPEKRASVANEQTRRRIFYETLRLQAFHWYQMLKNAERFQEIERTPSADAIKVSIHANQCHDSGLQNHWYLARTYNLVAEIRAAKQRRDTIRPSAGMEEIRIEFERLYSDDLTKGMGRIALKQHYAEVMKGQPSLFTFDLKAQRIEICFYPVLIENVCTQHLDEKEAMQILMAAVTRMFNEVCGFEKRYLDTKKRLNEKEFQRKRVEAVLRQDKAAVAQLEAAQAKLRCEYVAAVVQGLNVTRFVDRTLKDLENRMPLYVNILENRDSEDETRLALMANCISIVSWRVSIANALKSARNFEEIAKEPFIQSALADFHAVVSAELKAALK